MTELETAKRRAMHLIAAREYGKNELITKLMNNYSQATAYAVAELMCEYGYVDDVRYAAKLARQCIEIKHYGRSRTAMYLKQKGLDEETVRAALEEYSDEDITAEIAGLLRKKYADRLFLPGIEGRKEMQKITAALARRGYSWSDIKSALYIVKEEADDGEE